LPVFITPPTAKYKLGCTAEKTAIDIIKVTCENTGNAYAQPLDFVLTSPTGELLASSSTGGYILPTIKRSFDTKSENSKPITGGKAILNMKMDDGSKQTFDITLAK
jgi:fimbrial chaperone protein